MSALMRLRVPRGWAVLDNKFYDVSPIPAADSESFIDNWDEGFIEDTLWVQECILTSDGRGFTVPEFNCFNIDLGWYPDSRVEGCYQARLNWCNDNELRCVDLFESKDRFEIRDKIEFWMEDVKLRYDLYKAMAACIQF